MTAEEERARIVAGIRRRVWRRRFQGLRFDWAELLDVADQIEAGAGDWAPEPPAETW